MWWVVAVGAVELDPILNAVGIRVHRGRVGQEDESLEGVIEIIAIGVVVLRVGLRYPVDLGCEYLTSPRTEG